jgi:FAS-associated factor 2
MASSTLDVSALTDAQRSSLDKLIAITAQEPEPAIQLLQKCEWNVEISIARFFDGEPAVDPVAEALAQRPEDVRRQETLMNGFSTPPPRRDPNLEPAPRIVPQNDGQVAYRSNPLLSIIFMPVSLVYAVVSRAFRLFGYLFPFLPRLFGRIRGTSQGTSPRHHAGGRIALKPNDAALRLIREIEEEYGSNELPLFENGYAQALDAAKRDLKFLLVILLSPEHDDTSSFIRDTLYDPAVINYIKDPSNNILVWAGTVQDAEAYQVSAALSCTKFPFSAVIVHTPSVSSTAMSIVQRITGPMTARDYVSKLQRTIEQYSTGLTQTRRTREEQNAARSIRDQQNEAYERSLAQDRERTRRKREEEQRRKEEEERVVREEEERENYERNLSSWRRWRASQVLPEPGADVKDAVRISLRMPDGERVVRRFATDATIEELYAFVECYDVLQAGDVGEKVSEPVGFEHEYKFRLVSPMPREVYELEKGGTIKDRIGRSGNLIVEKTVIEDSDDDEE